MSEMNTAETALVADLMQTIDNSYTGGGIGCALFIGEKGALQEAANKVFALVETQGLVQTHDTVVKVQEELSKMTVGDFQSPRKVCHTLEKGLGLPRCAINIA